MTKVYNIIVEDRHADVQVLARSSALYAIKEARIMAAIKCHDVKDIEEHVVEGTLLFVTYSTEGDSIKVVECEIDEEVDS